MNVRLNSAPQVTISGGGRNVLRIPYRRLKAGFSVRCLCSTVFVCHWESSDWDWMKCPRCDCLLLESLFTFVWSLFITTACNFWRQIACRFEFKSEWKSFIIRQKKNIWNPAIFFKPGLTCEQRLHLRCGSCRAESSLCRQPFESVQKSGGIN